MPPRPSVALGLLHGAADALPVSSSGHVAAAEALVRWQHPRLGLLPPADFLPMAEHTSLSKPLTRRVLEQSMLQIVRWG